MGRSGATVGLTARTFPMSTIVRHRPRQNRQVRAASVRLYQPLFPCYMNAFSDANFLKMMSFNVADGFIPLKTKNFSFFNFIF